MDSRPVSEKVSAIMCVYNEENLIERALKSLVGVADEIIVMHDGPCSDNTLKIARKYTKNVIENKKNVGLPGPILPILFRKAKGPWILKIDADEFLSDDMKKHIPEMVKREDVNGYTFIWKFWDGKKYLTKDWPRKPSLYRKDKISYLGFPHFDDPWIKGNIIDTPYQLHHQPVLREKFQGWKDFYYRGLKRYGRIQAEWTLKDFSELDSFQWDLPGYPRNIRIRRDYPLLSALPMGIIAFFKILIRGKVWKNGSSVFIEALQGIPYYAWVGWKIYTLKRKLKR